MTATATRVSDARADAAIAAERLAVGSMLVSDEFADDGRGLLAGDDLIDHAARVVFVAVGELRDAGRSADPAAVLLRLRETGRDADLADDPAGFLGDMFAEAGAGVNLSYAAGLVRQAADRRRLTAVAYDLIRGAADGEPLGDLTARAAGELLRVADGKPGAAGPVRLRTAVRSALVRYDDADRDGASAAGVPTGFDALDHLTGGWRPGQLGILAARPGVGKSALQLGFAAASARAGIPVFVAALEMSTDENVDRLMSAAAGVPMSRLRGQSRMDSGDRERVLAAASDDDLGGLPIFIDDRPARSVAQIAIEVRRLARREGVRVACVDYLQLLAAENKRDPRYRQVGEMTRQLKELARSAGVTVIVGCQLNRECESRPDGRPKLSDLRDSGECEQDADLVMLLHRLDTDDTLPVHRIDLLLAKQRNGPTGTVVLNYVRRFTRFEPRVIG